MKMYRNFFLLVFLLASTAIFAQEGRLIVNVNDLDKDGGKLLISVFSEDDVFLKETEMYQKIDLDKDLESFQVIFDDIAPGKYTVSIIQDMNGNGELDMGMMGPSEPYGFSNDAKGFMGPPSLEDCQFEHPGGDFEIDIDLR